MKQLLIRVKGIPRPQPRPRLARGRVVSTQDPKARAWSDAIVRASHGLRAPAGPLSVRMAFAMPTPRKDRHGLPHTFRPDADNLAKLALDALIRSGTIDDDAEVSSLVITKAWAPPHAPGLALAIGPDLSQPQEGPSLPSWLAQEAG